MSYIENNDQIRNRDNFNVDEIVQDPVDQPLNTTNNDNINARISEYKKKKQSRNPVVRFVTDHPFITVLIAAVILVIVILAIVLPLTLIKKPEERRISPQCPDGRTQPRIDCLPDRIVLQQVNSNFEAVCKQRGCCWSSSPEQGGPSCALPYNFGFRQLKYKENTHASQWLELVRMNSPSSFARSDISNLELRVDKHTDYRLRIRIFPRRNYKNKIQRWEVPSGIKSEHLFKPNYNVEFSDAPFSLKVSRVDTDHVIFDTTKSSLIFSDQFIQLTTVLSSPYVFGIGENSKERFMHDMNFRTWPIFASMNHPTNANEKPNLYSQFPMYLNIEPDGNSHLVVFYNSNPSEIHLTPFPSLTYTTIGGILDIYIFTGPTPLQALEQFHQAFGLPKLPPYWSMGLQIGAKHFENSSHLKEFIKDFKDTKLPFDSVQVGVEHMRNGSMFTVSDEFYDINEITEQLRSENRAIIVELLPAITNHTQNLPFSEGVSREKYWIMENFFSLGVIGKLLGNNVLYPDFTLEKTREWWKDAFQRFVVTDQVLLFDGVYMDYLTPYDENLNKTCPNNKWNNPPYVPGAIMGNIWNGTICMDSRYEIGKHYNIHGMYSHRIIEATAKAFDALIHNRTLIVSRHAFIGTGQYSAKWIGEYHAKWDDFRRSIISTVEMSMFGFSMSGGDICGYSGDFERELCENWLKASAMSPMMKLIVDTGDDTDEKFRSLTSNGFYEIFNSSLCLRYSLLPYLYTQMYKATKYGTPPLRPLAFDFPTDIRTFQVDNQWLWGDKLMVTIGTMQGGASSTYLPKGDWYDYYRGFHRFSNGEFVNIQTRQNETNLNVKGGSVLFKQDCMQTATHSKNSFVDIIIALNETDNYTASGELYIDDHYRKNTERKENYHRLIMFTVIRKENDGIIEAKKISGRFLTRLSYRDLIIFGLRSKPSRITVNENSQGIDGSKCVWDEVNRVYYVNLQTEVKRKVLLDTEYLSFRWTGGFENVNRNTNNNQFNFN